MRHVCRVSVWFSLINLHGVFNLKSILKEKPLWSYLTHNWKDKELHTFTKGISLKVNVEARREFELLLQGPVQYFSHYAI